MANYSDTDETNNSRYCFDHMERPASEGGYDSEWFDVLFAARWASVLVFPESHIYLDMEWGYMSEATQGGVVFG